MSLGGPIMYPSSGYWRGTGRVIDYKRVRFVWELTFPEMELFRDLIPNLAGTDLEMWIEFAKGKIGLNFDELIANVMGYNKI